MFWPSYIDLTHYLTVFNFLELSKKKPFRKKKISKMGNQIQKISPKVQELVSEDRKGPIVPKRIWEQMSFDDCNFLENYWLETQWTNENAGLSVVSASMSIMYKHNQMYLWGEKKINELVEENKSLRERMERLEQILSEKGQ
jgi:hypothetical protein